ncbi:MAG: FecR domain-containing protein [Scytolyngbya sp. HA4215-MV1]|jgi:hypothetical protein|nr:FecR domain-containing protein [Scytolyngbya sp. HA4215-MV1]
MKLRDLLTGILIGLILSLSLKQSMAQQSVQVRVERWISLEKMTGTVIYQRGNTSRPAKIGDRLIEIGDGISTGNNASATLVIDSSIGSITVFENTKLRLQALEYAADNGRITQLQVDTGQVRLKLRPFTHRGSILEINTPAGLSGVRGTDFGLSVQPNGKTGLAVSEGRVVTAAQSRQVPVNAGFQNFTVPNEAPSEPVPLADNPYLEYKFQHFIQAGVRKVRLIGQTDPVNRVVVQGIPQNTDREGRFQSELLSLPNRLKLRVIVTTPLGKQGVYEPIFQ